MSKPFILKNKFGEITPEFINGYLSAVHDVFQHIKEESEKTGSPMVNAFTLSDRIEATIENSTLLLKQIMRNGRQ